MLRHEDVEHMNIWLWDEVIKLRKTNAQLLEALEGTPNPLSRTDWDTHICGSCFVERESRPDGSPCTPFPHLDDCWVTKRRAAIELARKPDPDKLRP